MLPGGRLSDQDEEEEEGEELLLRREIAQLEAEVSIQTSLALPSLTTVGAEHLQHVLQSPTATTATSSRFTPPVLFTILVTLKLNSHVVADEEKAPQVSIPANRWDMRLQDVLDLVCEYWGVRYDHKRSSSSNLVLLNELGVWRQLSHRVIELEPATHTTTTPLTVLLFLSEKPSAVGSVRHALEWGEPVLQYAETGHQLVAPVLVLPGPAVVVAARTTAAKSLPPPPQELDVAAAAAAAGNETSPHPGWFRDQRRHVKMYVRGLRDPFLFSTRRWVLDWMLCLAMLVVFSLFIVQSLSWHSSAAARLLFAHVQQELLQCDYNLMQWMATSPSLVPFLQHDFYGFGQSSLVDGGGLLLSQHRVRLLPDGSAPAYTEATALRDPTWQSSPLTDVHDTFVGRFGTYGPLAYVQHLLPAQPFAVLNQTLTHLQGAEVGWVVDNCTRLTTLHFSLINRNFNDTIAYWVFVETNAADLAFVHTRVEHLSTDGAAATAAATWFTFLASVLLALTGLDLVRTVWFVRQTGLTAGEAFRALSLRNTFFNPIIFVLGVWGTAASTGGGLTVLALCNVFVCVKFYTYFPLGGKSRRTLFVFAREYWRALTTNLMTLMVVLALCMLGFAWLLLAAGGGSGDDDFNATFMWLVRRVVRGVPAVWWEMPFAVGFVSVASQLVVNVLVLRQAVPMAYSAANHAAATSSDQ